MGVIDDAAMFEIILFFRALFHFFECFGCIGVCTPIRTLGGVFLGGSFRAYSSDFVLEEVWYRWDSLVVLMLYL